MSDVVWSVIKEVAANAAETVIMVAASVKAAAFRMPEVCACCALNSTAT